MKHIRLFEQFVTEAELSGRDQSYKDRGMNVLTRQQAALCYCIAQGWANEIRVGGTDSRLSQVASDMNTWGGWAEMPQQTINHRVRQLKTLLGKDESTWINDEPYKKLVDFFNGFEDMPKAEVLVLASDAVAGEPDADTATKYALPKPKKLQPKDIEFFGKAVDAAMRGLQGANGNLADADARRKALKMVADKDGKDPEEATELYAAWKKRESAKVGR